MDKLIWKVNTAATLTLRSGVRVMETIGGVKYVIQSAKFETRPEIVCDDGDVVMAELLRTAILAHLHSLQIEVENDIAAWKEHMECVSTAHK